MIRYPKIKASSVSRQKLDTFKGLNLGERIGDGEFSGMENLCSDDYPVLSPRKPRGLIGQLQDEGQCLGMHYVPGHGLFTVHRVHKQEGTGVFLSLLKPDGSFAELAMLSDTPKQFAVMGSQLIIAPDMYRVWLEGSYSAHPLEERWTCKTGQLTVEMCDTWGNVYDIKTTGTQPPTGAVHRELWLDTGAAGLKQYDATSGQWITVESTYLRLIGVGDHYFEAGDGITISGMKAGTPGAKLNGSHVLHRVGQDTLIIPGLLDGVYTQDLQENPVTFHREVPQMDFLVEAGNRLWGCAKDGHEIYGCKLGDPTNWNCFQGLSTDSYAATVGTPGGFTGAAVQGGYPIFYKEGYRHKVWPSATGAHQITASPWEGVQQGSGNSVAVLGGTVFYKSPCGVCADDGGGTVSIGEALGDIQYRDGIGAVHDGKYYLCLREPDGQHSLFVYDTRRRLWHRENSSFVGGMCSGNGILYGGIGKDIWDLTGSTGTPEEPPDWVAETGDLGLELPDRKYISRLTLRLMLQPGARLEVLAQYDREPEWVSLGTVYGTRLGSFSLPVRPRRCDHLRLQLKGTGKGKLYSITKTLEKGSELP